MVKHLQRSFRFFDFIFLRFFLFFNIILNYCIKSINKKVADRYECYCAENNCGLSTCPFYFANKIAPKITIIARIKQPYIALFATFGFSNINWYSFSLIVFCFSSFNELLHVIKYFLLKVNPKYTEKNEISTIFYL